MITIHSRHLRIHAPGKGQDHHPGLNLVALPVDVNMSEEFLDLSQGIDVSLHAAPSNNRTRPGVSAASDRKMFNSPIVKRWLIDYSFQGAAIVGIDIRKQGGRRYRVPAIMSKLKV